MNTWTMFASLMVQQFVSLVLVWLDLAGLCVCVLTIFKRKIHGIGNTAKIDKDNQQFNVKYQISTKLKSIIFILFFIKNISEIIWFVRTQPQAALAPVPLGSLCKPWNVVQQKHPSCHSSELHPNSSLLPPCTKLVYMRGGSS